jgi:DNA-binding transcriptional LysR family regulator
MLDVAKLATLRAVIEHGSFSGAGVALSLTQPAVSRQVSLLEQQLGTQLVRRTRQGVHPTEAGCALAARRGHPRPGCGELDLAIVFEHAFDPDPAPEGVELIALFDDPPRVLLPGDHRLARRRRIAVSDLAGDAWVRAHEGSGARLVDHVLMHAGLRPPIVLVGRGDEPVEAQAFVAAGKGVTIAHELGVIISDRIAVRPLSGGAPVRHIQAALMEGQLAPAARAALEALRTAARARRHR